MTRKTKAWNVLDVSEWITSYLTAAAEAKFIHIPSAHSEVVFCAAGFRI